MTAGPLVLYLEASMKARPKRKENTAGYRSATQPAERLNESPYEKVGKSDQWKISEIHGGKPQ